MTGITNKINTDLITKTYRYTKTDLNKGYIQGNIIAENNEITITKKTQMMWAKKKKDIICLLRQRPKNCNHGHLQIKQ